MAGARLDNEKMYVWNIKNTAGRIEIRGQKKQYKPFKNV
jgi:hypothetical protein